MKQIIKLISIVLVAGINIAKGQVTVSGPTKVRAGATVTYRVTAPCPSGYCWGASSFDEPAGTFSPSGCGAWVEPTSPANLSSCGCPGNMNITFNNYTVKRNVTVVAEDKCRNMGALSVTVVPPLADNIAISPSSGQTVSCGATGAALIASAPSGGDGSYTYQWQSSTDNSSWTDISAATGSSYTPSGFPQL